MSQRATPRRLWRRVLLACGLTLTMVAPAWAQGGHAARSGLDGTYALRVSQEAVGRQIGEHVLLNREGKPVALSSYRGKPLLVSFIYTGCFSICPTTTRSLQNAVNDLQKAVGPNQFNVVSVGFNQPEDSPQALKSFARQNGINNPNWDFLSPPMTSVAALAKDFGFVYAATSAGFDHVLQVSVLDAEGRIVHQVYGEKLAAGDLGEPLKMLLAGKTYRPSSALLDNLMDRVRILCTVYDPRTGGYKVDYSLPLQIAGGITFFIVMMLFFFNEWRAGRARRKGSRGAT